MALVAYRARPESLERCSQLSWFPFRSVDTQEHTDLAVPDEERCCDEAQDQRPQQHGVTELEEPHTQQTTHLDQVESGHLKKTHTQTDTHTAGQSLVMMMWVFHETGRTEHWTLTGVTQQHFMALVSEVNHSSAQRTRDGISVWRIISMNYYIVMITNNYELLHYNLN